METNKNIQWLNQQKGIDRYENQWVAISDCKVVAHDKDPENIMPEVRKISKGQRVTILKIPPKNAVMIL